MDENEWIQGREMQGTEPDWEPMLKLLDEDLVGYFMWMFEANLEDGTSVQAYKNSVNRRYLFLDASGSAYRWEWGRGYCKGALKEMLEEAFRGMDAHLSWQEE